MCIDLDKLFQYQYFGELLHWILVSLLLLVHQLPGSKAVKIKDLYFPNKGGVKFNYSEYLMPILYNIIGGIIGANRFCSSGMDLEEIRILKLLFFLLIVHLK